jgi:hypothetical protein
MKMKNIIKYKANKKEVIHKVINISKKGKLLKIFLKLNIKKK